MIRPLAPVRAAAACAALLAAAACSAVPRPATTPPPINTSRLGMAKGTGVVAPGVLQLETGYMHAHQDGRTREQFGETLLRLGVGANTELRGGLAGYQRTATPTTEVQGIADVALFVKHKFSDAKGWVPSVSLMAGALFPTGSDAVSAKAVQPDGMISAEWKLLPQARAVAMVQQRSAVLKDDRYGQTTVAVGARYLATKNLAAQLEYGAITATRAGALDVHHIRAGAALRLTPSIQLDGWAGRATTAKTREYLFGIGLSQRW